MIKRLTQLSGETLNLVQPSVWKNNYEIKHGDELIGTVLLKGFGFRLIVKILEDEWEIYRPSFWKSEISIKEKGRENPSATYKRKLFSREGIVSLSMGHKLIIKLGLLRSGYGIYTTNGSCLASLKDKISLKEKTEINIDSNSELLDKYPWVIVLAWYLSKQRRRSAAAG